MTTIDTVVVGAGHAGLAVSRLLTDAGRDHVVLDRGRVGERWRTERWDSLHLLTPSWMTRLPGWSYAGPDPDGYLSVGAFVGYLEAYAASFGAPVVDGTRPCSPSRPPAADPARRYRVVTSRGTWHARHVVIATGPHGTPYVPAGLAGRHGVDAGHLEPLPQPRPARRRAACSSSARRRPALQIADELNRAGRDVTLAVGRHTRMPRRYRGMDIFWWLESDRPPGPDHRRGGRPRGRAPGDLAAARRSRRPRRGPPRTSTSAALQARGVRLVGRLETVDGRTARFRDDLAATVGAADATLDRLLDSLDHFVERIGLAGEVWDSPRPRPVAIGTPRRRAPRPARRGHRHRAGGHRLPPRPPVAAAADHRPGREPSASTAASPPPRASTSSGSASSTGATPATSTGPGTTRGTVVAHLLAASGAPRPATAGSGAERQEPAA